MSGLSDTEQAALADIFAHIPSIERVVLFGSRATGKHRPNSDVDLVLYGDALTYPHMLQAKSLIEETTLPYFFDLILATTIEREALLAHIGEFGQVIYLRA